MEVSLESELLRRGVLARGALALDPLALTCASTADIRILRDVHRWEGSNGLMHANIVWLGTTAETLGRLHQHPASFDVLCECFSAEVAMTPGQSLEELELWWSQTSNAWVDGFRGSAFVAASRSQPQDLLVALHEILASRDARSLIPQVRGVEWKRGWLGESLLVRTHGPLSPEDEEVLHSVALAVARSPERRSPRVQITQRS